MDLFITELEQRVAPACIIPLHGNPPCRDTVVFHSPSPDDAALAHADGNAPFQPQFTTLAIGEETGGF